MHVLVKPTAGSCVAAMDHGAYSSFPLAPSALSSDSERHRSVCMHLYMLLV